MGLLGWSESGALSAGKIDRFGVAWLWEVPAGLKACSHAFHCSCPGQAAGARVTAVQCLLPASRNTSALIWIFPDKTERHETTCLAFLEFLSSFAPLFYQAPSAEDMQVQHLTAACVSLAN